MSLRGVSGLRPSNSSKCEETPSLKNFVTFCTNLVEVGGLDPHSPPLRYGIGVS